MSRPGKDEWAMGVAQAVALRGDCTRRQVGATIRNADWRIVGEGYNGTEPGGPSCLAGQCPRGLHYQVAEAKREFPPHLPCFYPGVEGHEGCTPPLCACGEVWPCADAVEPGSSYDTGPGACINTHAEANALIDANGRELIGCMMHVTAEPCGGCMKLIRLARLSRVVWPGGVIRVHG